MMIRPLPVFLFLLLLGTSACVPSSQTPHPADPSCPDASSKDCHESPDSRDDDDLIASYDIVLLSSNEQEPSLVLADSQRKHPPRPVHTLSQHLETLRLSASPTRHLISWTAFSTKQKTWSLTILDLQTMKTRNVPLSHGNDIDPVWSPDHRYIAMRAPADEDGMSHVFVYDLEVDTVEIVDSMTSLHACTSLTWDTNGTTLHYNAQNEVFSFDLNTKGRLRRTLPNVSYTCHLNTSPENQTLLLTGFDVQKNQWALYSLPTSDARANLSAHVPIRLDTPEASWTPRGHELTILDEEDTGRLALRSVHAQTGRTDLLKLWDHDVWVTHPVWAPDNKRLLISSVDPNGHVHISLLHRDGRLTKLARQAWRAVWLSSPLNLELDDD